MKGCSVEKNYTFFCRILKLPQFCFCPLQKVTYHFDQFQEVKFCIKVALIIQIQNTLIFCVKYPFWRQCAKSHSYHQLSKPFSCMPRSYLIPQNTQYCLTITWLSNKLPQWLQTRYMLVFHQTTQNSKTHQISEPEIQTQLGAKLMISTFEKFKLDKT